MFNPPARRVTGGSSRLQREGPKPANADVIHAHQVYIGKVRFRKGGGKPHFGPPKPEFGPVAPPPHLDPPVRRFGWLRAPITTERAWPEQALPMEVCTIGWPNELARYRTYSLRPFFTTGSVHRLA